NPFPATATATGAGGPSSLQTNYATYLGGSSADKVIDVTTDATGNTFVTGWTSSPNFPTTPGAYETTLSPDGSRAAFVAKFDPNGNLLWSTEIDGAAGFAIAVDASDNVYVGGEANGNDFATTAGAFQTTPGSRNTGFVAKLNSSGTELLWATYLGGSGGD